MPRLERTPRHLVQAAVPTFIGIGIGLGLAGMMSRLGTTVIANVAAIPGSVVAAVALAALALGIRIAQDVTFRCVPNPEARGTAGTWRKAWNGQGATFDQTLLAKRFAVVTLLGGAAAALLPLQAHLAQAFYRQAHATFVWSDVSLVPLQFIVAGLALMVPFCLLGASVLLAHGQGGAPEGWSHGVFVALLLGVAIGTALARSLQSNPDLMLVGSSLPVLLSSLLIAVMIAEERPAFMPAGLRDDATRPDEWDIHPGALPNWLLVSTAAMVVVGHGVFQEAGWSHAVAIGCAAIGMLSAGCDAQYGCRCVARRFVICGIAVMLLALCARYGAPSGGMVTRVLAMVTLVLLGHVVAIGNNALSNRVRDQFPIGGIFLARELLVCALMVGVLLPIGRYWIDWPQLLLVAGLSVGCSGVVLFTQGRLVISRGRDGLLLLTGAGAAVLAITCF